MIILRVFLYLICIISIGWSVLVFGGPPIIKRLISGYSDGALIPSGITVTPGLDVGISRLEFNFQKEIVGWHIEGFSRSTEIAWSLFGEKPFLEINFGPSLVKDYATADSVNVYIPSFEKLDWQNLTVAVDIDSLVLPSFAKAKFVTLAVEGNVNFKLAKVSDVIIEAENFNVTHGNSTYSAGSIKGDLSELKYNNHLTEQLFSSTFALEDIVASEPNFSAPEATMEISVKEEARNLKIDLYHVNLSEFGGSVGTLKFDGRFNQSSDLQELQIDFVDSILFDRLPKFPSISAKVNKSGNERYQGYIEGALGEFELSHSGSFVGFLPSGNFVIDLELDRAASKIISISKISFDTLDEIDIIGSIEMEFTSERLTKLACALVECEFSDFELAYQIDFGDEWVRGNVDCPNGFCDLLDMDYLVTTSNTVNIFTTLNQANILNPVASFYLYGAISSGQKINDGHQLKFQF